MRGDDQHEAWWLGGEAQVYPRMAERKSIPLKHALTGGVLLLAGMGIGHLTATGSETRGTGRRHNRIGNSATPMPSERSMPMEQNREMARPGGSGSVDGLGVVTILAAFGLGLVAGAVTTLLSTPESGTSVRNRLKRGMDTAKKEFDETVGEVKQDWSAVGDEICDSVKRTASRVKQAAEITKDALTDGNNSDVTARRMP
jgi:gas vesicle protein